MKQTLLSLAVCVFAMAVLAQTETRGKPGLVVNKAAATPALSADVQQRGMAMTFDRVLQSLDGHLSATAVGSRKFTVLERGDDLNTVLDDPAKLGQELKLRPSDYALLIKLDSFVDAKDSLADGDAVLVKRRFQLSGQVRIVGGTTAEILDMSNLQVEKVDVVQSDNAVRTNQQDARLDEMMPQLAREFAEKSFARLMGVAFPAKVLDAEDGVITINRGEGFFAAGDKVQIFGKAKTIVDEDTGETMKIKGKVVGSATVTSVEPNYAQAKADGAFTVTAGAEVRKAQ